MLSQGFYPQIVLSDQRATREATHPLELTAVNNTHELVVQQDICRRLGVAPNRSNNGPSTKNMLARESMHIGGLEPSTDRSTAEQGP